MSTQEIIELLEELVNFLKYDAEDWSLFDCELARQAVEDAKAKASYVELAIERIKEGNDGQL